MVLQCSYSPFSFSVSTEAGESSGQTIHLRQSRKASRHQSITEIASGTRPCGGGGGGGVRTLRQPGQPNSGVQRIKTA